MYFVYISALLYREMNHLCTARFFPETLQNQMTVAFFEILLILTMMVAGFIAFSREVKARKALKLKTNGRSLKKLTILRKILSPLQGERTLKKCAVEPLGEVFNIRPNGRVRYLQYKHCRY